MARRSKTTTWTGWWFWILAFGILLLAIGLIVWYNQYRGLTVPWWVWALIIVGVVMIIVALGLAIWAAFSSSQDVVETTTTDLTDGYYHEEEYVDDMRVPGHSRKQQVVIEEKRSVYNPMPSNNREEDLVRGVITGRGDYSYSSPQRQVTHTRIRTRSPTRR